MKVLIVDDSKAMRMIVKRTLFQTDLGKCNVIEAEDGAQALSMVQEDTPDLILCDWNMPTMSGIDFLKELRATGSEVPFGFITTESGEQSRELAMETGAQFLIKKPFNADALNAQVSTLAL